MNNPFDAIQALPTTPAPAPAPAPFAPAAPVAITAPVAVAAPAPFAPTAPAPFAPTAPVAAPAPAPFAPTAPVAVAAPAPFAPAAPVAVAATVAVTAPQAAVVAPQTAVAPVKKKRKSGPRTKLTQQAGFDTLTVKMYLPGGHASKIMSYVRTQMKATGKTMVDTTAELFYNIYAQSQQAQAINQLQGSTSSGRRNGGEPKRITELRELYASQLDSMTLIMRQSQASEEAIAYATQKFTEQRDAKIAEVTAEIQAQTKRMQDGRAAAKQLAAQSAALVQPTAPTA